MVALAGLLHDCDEALGLPDVPRPVKYSMPFYKEAGERIQEVVFRKFGLPYPMPDIVHLADTYTMMTGTGVGIDGLMYPLDAKIFEVPAKLFLKMTYLERPEGWLAVFRSTGASNLSMCTRRTNWMLEYLLVQNLRIADT